MRCPNCKNETAHLYGAKTPSGWMCESCGATPSTSPSMESKINDRIDYVPIKNGQAGGVFIKDKYMRG